jgi:predicted CoA-binding protein
MKTLVLGASTNPARYSFLAVNSLIDHGHEVIPVGLKKGSINGFEILNGKPELTDIDTVTLYLNAANQADWYDYILNLHPRRIIFNPGTENNELDNLAQDNGIQTVIACTLVMLSTGVFDDATIEHI